MAERRKGGGEKIARLDVKSTYRDIRDGIGGNRANQLETSDQDIAAALGLVRLSVGKAPVLVLETFYGSHVRHEAALRRLWADFSEQPSDPAEARIRNRVAAALAIRQFAGASPSGMSEWGELMAQDPTQFKKLVNRVLSWLEEQRGIGMNSLRKKMAEHRASVDARKKRA